MGNPFSAVRFLAYGPCSAMALALRSGLPLRHEDANSTYWHHRGCGEGGYGGGHTAKDRPQGTGALELNGAGMRLQHLPCPPIPSFPLCFSLLTPLPSPSPLPHLPPPWFSPSCLQHLIPRCVSHPLSGAGWCVSNRTHGLGFSPWSLLTSWATSPSVLICKMGVGLHLLRWAVESK